MGAQGGLLLQKRQTGEGAVFPHRLLMRGQLSLGSLLLNLITLKAAEVGAKLQHSWVLGGCYFFPLVFGGNKQRKLHREGGKVLGNKFLIFVYPKQLHLGKP